MLQGSTSASALDRPRDQLVDRQQLGGGPIQFVALDRQPGAGDLAANLATHAGRSGRHHVGLPPGRVGVAHRREQQRQMNVLQLGCPPPGQKMIQMLPGAGQRLPPCFGFGPQAIAVRPRDAGQQLLIVGVAIGRDLLHQGRQRGRRAVRVGAAAASARGHQHRAGQHGRRLEPQFVGIEIAGRKRPGRQGVEHDLLQHEPAIAPLAVEVVRVPLAEMVVRPLVHRMVKIVLPRIDGQLVDQVDIEPGFGGDRPIGRAEDFQRLGDQPLVAAGADADSADEQRNRPDPFMFVGFDPPRRPQGRHRAMADEVVQKVAGLADDPFGFIPWPPGVQHRFADPAEEERPPQGGIRLAGQKIAVKLAIGRGKRWNTRSITARACSTSRKAAVVPARAGSASRSRSPAIRRVSSRSPPPLRSGDTADRGPPGIRGRSCPTRSSNSPTALPAAGRRNRGGVWPSVLRASVTGGNPWQRSRQTGPSYEVAGNSV